MTKDNLVGKKFTRLLVLEDDRKASNTKGFKYCKCKCECGKEVVVRRDRLTANSTRSCGCIRDLNPGATAKLKITIDSKTQFAADWARIANISPELVLWRYRAGKVNSEIIAPVIRKNK